MAYALQAFFALLALLLVALLICGILYIRERPSPPVPTPPDTTSVDTSPPTDTTTVDTPPTDAPDIPPAAYEPYEFGTPLKESVAVPDEWFDDVVFLGDSRT